MEPLKNIAQEENRQPTGFVLANNQPCKISEKARRKALQAAAELFDFSNNISVEELRSHKRKANADKRPAKKGKLVEPEPVVCQPVAPRVQLPEVSIDEMSDWNGEDSEDIDWSDCDDDLSRTITDIDKSLRVESSGGDTP